MENWRKQLYENYSTYKNKQNINTKKDCSYFKKTLLNHLPEDKNISIIDLAAGHGGLLYCLKKTGYNNIKGVDISKEEVKIAKENNIEVIENDIIKFLRETDEQFDVIFMMDILEHFNRQEFFDVLNFVYKKLNKNGKLIAQVPNASGIFGMRIRYGDITHETCFTHNSIIQSMGAIGFKKTNIFEVQPIKKGLKGFIRNLLWNLFVLPFRIIFYLETGRKKSYLTQNLSFIAHK